jgi:hypothetical protein
MHSAQHRWSSSLRICGRLWSHHITVVHPKVAVTRSTQSRLFSDSSVSPIPVTCFTEEERLTRDAARRWAKEELQPVVREMESKEALHPSIINSLFIHGFMGMVGSISAYLIIIDYFDLIT